MIHTRAKTIVRRILTLALCASLGSSNALAYDAHKTIEIPITIPTIEETITDPNMDPTLEEDTIIELPMFQDAGVLALLPYGLLAPSASTTVGTVNSLTDMQAARETVEPPRTYQATPRTIYKSTAFAADEIVQEDGDLLGEYRLSFYCPCATCNGNTHSITKSGTKLTQGRTIAVDDDIIPLGSKVYIDGYGVFIAEDTGGAIKGNRIDICVGSHSQAYKLGIDYADVYLLDVPGADV